MLEIANYLDQKAVWPTAGRHILAQYDDDSIIVYQAYRPSIGNFALKNGYFGGEFKLNRMSWIKPNFLWMMYRSGWGTKRGQEICLAIRIQRSFFDSVLEQAVPSPYAPNLYSTLETWKNALTSSSVRLQWDPDHDPTGKPLKRRAIQLGLRGTTLKRYSREVIMEIIDLSGFVAKQREHIKSGETSKLMTPKERIYFPENSDIIKRLNLSKPSDG